MAATQTFDRCYEQVWAPTGASTPYELAYWRATMQKAWQHKHKPGNKPSSPIYAIKNPKARAALRCDQCKRAAVYAVYASLSLHCDEHAPEGASAMKRPVGPI